MRGRKMCEMLRPRHLFGDERIVIGIARMPQKARGTRISEALQPIRQFLQQNKDKKNIAGGADEGMTAMQNINQAPTGLWLNF